MGPEVDIEQIDPINNRETFRPVSILDGGLGLDINENDCNYELNRNLRATINDGLNGASFYEGRGEFSSFARKGSNDMS